MKPPGPSGMAPSAAAAAAFYAASTAVIKAAATVAAVKAGLVVALKAIGVLLLALLAIAIGVEAGQLLGTTLSWLFFDFFAPPPGPTGNLVYTNPPGAPPGSGSGAGAGGVFSAIALEYPSIATLSDQFDSLGETPFGAAAATLLQRNVDAYATLAHVVAAKNMGDRGRFAMAVAQFEQQMAQIPAAALAVAGEVESYTFVDPRQALTPLLAQASMDVQHARMSVQALIAVAAEEPFSLENEEAIAGYEESVQELDYAAFQLGMAAGALANTPTLPTTISGDDSWLANSTLDGFETFIASCQTGGEACLPKGETTFVQTIIAGEGIEFDGEGLSLGSALAKWDADAAFYDPAGEEQMHFLMTDEPGTMRLDELLRITVDVQSYSGTYLNVNISDSALYVDFMAP